MPKKPKSRFSSPFSSSFVNARRSVAPVTSFSPAVLRGIVRGLLFHIGLQNKRTNRWLQKAEKKVMTHATALMETSVSKELTGDRTSHLIENICDEVQRMLREKNQHTYLTLNADDARILPALTRDQSASQHAVYDKLAFMRPYDEMEREEQRVAWLDEEIPAILKVLQASSVCLHPVCASRVECIAPSPDTLLKWAHSPHAGALRNNILGHFHGLTPARVKRLLSARPKTLPLR